MDQVKGYFDLTDLSRHVAASTGKDSDEVKDLIKKIFEVLAQKIGEGEDIVLKDIGTFYKSVHNERPWYTFWNSKRGTIPRCYRVEFKAALWFRNRVRANLSKDVHQLPILE